MTVREERAYRVTCDDPNCAQRNGQTTTQRVWAMTPYLALFELTGWNDTEDGLRCGACSLRMKLEAATR